MEVVAGIAVGALLFAPIIPKSEARKRADAERMARAYGFVRPTPERSRLFRRSTSPKRKRSDSKARARARLAR